MLIPFTLPVHGLARPAQSQSRQQKRIRQASVGALAECRPESLLMRGRVVRRRGIREPSAGDAFERFEAALAVFHRAAMALRAET